jgi:hypothetical protein
MDLSKDWEYIEGISEKRLGHNKTDRHVSRYGTAIEILGAAGELAARRFLGLPEGLHDQFDGGVDFVWRGYLVDVKTTKLTPKLNHRFLQWREDKELKADIVLFAAVDLQPKKATVVGWAWADEVREAPINLERDFPCHEIPATELHNAWELYILASKTS